MLRYMGIGYWLFRAGFDPLNQFVVVGSLFSKRILFLIFFFSC